VCLEDRDGIAQQKNDDSPDWSLSGGARRGIDQAPPEIRDEGRAGFERVGAGGRASRSPSRNFRKIGYKNHELLPVHKGVD
jgi:hypothetical protein